MTKKTTKQVEIRPEIQALIDATKVGLKNSPAPVERNKLGRPSPWVEEHNFGRKIGPNEYYRQHFARYIPSSATQQNVETVTHTYTLPPGVVQRSRILIVHNHPYGQPCWPKDRCYEHEGSIKDTGLEINWKTNSEKGSVPSLD